MCCLLERAVAVLRPADVSTTAQHPKPPVMADDVRRLTRVQRAIHRRLVCVLHCELTGLEDTSKRLIRAEAWMVARPDPGWRQDADHPKTTHAIQSLLVASYMSGVVRGRRALRRGIVPVNNPPCQLAESGQVARKTYHDRVHRAGPSSLELHIDGLRGLHRYRQRKHPAVPSLLCLTW